MKSNNKSYDWNKQKDELSCILSYKGKKRNIKSPKKNRKQKSKRISRKINRKKSRRKKSKENQLKPLRGKEIYYNFVKKHEALNYKTPSELAIPELKFETPNRWLELINLSNQKD